MNVPDENTLEVSFPKALVFSSASMAIFAIGLIAIGVPMHDPLLVAFLFVMVVGMTITFAVICRFMLRCRIDQAGLRSAVPSGHQRVLGWSDIIYVRRRFPFYVVRGQAFGEFCLLPFKFLLKQPDRMERLIVQFAPSDNVLRKYLGF